MFSAINTFGNDFVCIILCFTKWSYKTNEIDQKLKCMEFNIIPPHLSHFFMLVVKMSISYRTERNIGYLLIWLINTLGAHRHTLCRVKPNEKETEVIKMGTFDKSCGELYRFDKYLVPEIYNFKESAFRQNC